MEIRFPLYVRTKDSGEIYSFDSVDELQYELEKTDVENSEYEAWDSTGVPVGFVVQRPVWLEVVPLEKAVASPDLIDAVTQFAQSLGVQLNEPITIDKVDGVLAILKTAHETQLQEASPTRRLIARLRKPRPRT